MQTKLIRISVASTNKMHECKEIFRRARKLNKEWHISDRFIMEEIIDYYHRKG